MPPKQVVWCGGDAVVLLFEGVGDAQRTVLVLGPNASYVAYKFNEAVYLQQECDGVRIFLQSGVEYLHRVSSIRSTHPLLSLSLALSACLSV